MRSKPTGEQSDSTDIGKRKAFDYELSITINPHIQVMTSNSRFYWIEKKSSETIVYHVYSLGCLCLTIFN
jgi:hypothetical protein